LGFAALDGVEKLRLLLLLCRMAFNRSLMGSCEVGVRLALLGS